jgi:hypothetical protein
MNQIKKNYKLLEFIATCKPYIRQSILENADKNLINLLCECVFNVLNGTVKVDQKTLNKIKKYKHYLRKIGCQNKSLKQSQRILKQSGAGWIPFLIPPILEIVRNIFS